MSAFLAGGTIFRALSPLMLLKYWMMMATVSVRKMEEMRAELAAARPTAVTKALRRVGVQER